MSEYVFRTEEPIEYCFLCPINNQENGRCRLGAETDGCEIPKNCPLKELPPHGRLIDANELSYHTITDYKLEGHNVVDLEDIENAPTVLEASDRDRKEGE